MPNVDYCTCCIVQQSPFDFRLYEEWRDWPCRLVFESSPKSKICNGRVIMFQSHFPSIHLNAVEANASYIYFPSLPMLKT